MRFFDYFNVVTRSPQAKSVSVAPLVAAIGLYIISMLLFGDAGFLPLFAVFAFCSGIALYCTYCSSPNLEAVFPAGHKRKLFYRFMASLFLLFIVVATIFAVCAVGILIAQIFEPSTISEVIADCGAMFKAMGVYGCLFSLAYFIILYSAGMITGFFKRRKYRNIFLPCLCAALCVSDFFMLLPYYNMYGTFAGASQLYSNACYDVMALPWLCIVFWFIIAFAMLGWAIYLGVKHYDPKKY